MSIQEINYRKKMERLAKRENILMRKGMGYNTAKDEIMTSPILNALDDMGEGTAEDIARRLSLKTQHVRQQLHRLRKLSLVKSEKVNSGPLPSIWSIDAR